MKINSIVPYAGGKRTMGPAIVRELGPHQKYDEPFCGSLAVLFAKEKATTETVNDLYGDLINLARVLKEPRAAEELHRRLYRTLMHEDLLHEAAERWRVRGRQSALDAPDVDRAEDFMICSWFGRNGVCGTESYNQGFSLRFTKNGGHTGNRWTAVVDSIPGWHERLREVTILNRNGLELLARMEDAAGCAVYVDPPYIQKGFAYVHDFSEADHARLATLLGRFKKTRVVVSYYEHPSLADWYPGWTKLDMYRRRSLSNTQSRGLTGQASIAPEVLIINGPSFQEQGVFWIGLPNATYVRL